MFGASPGCVSAVQDGGQKFVTTLLICGVATAVAVAFSGGAAGARPCARNFGEFVLGENSVQQTIFLRQEWFISGKSSCAP
jgi:hypothetical protein